MRFHPTFYYPGGADYTPFTEPHPDGGSKATDFEGETPEAVFELVKALYIDHMANLPPMRFEFADGSGSVEERFDPGTPIRVVLISAHDDPVRQVVVFDYATGGRL